MSSLPKQHSPIPSSSTSKQSALRANTTTANTAATAPIASSRPRPIGQLSESQRHDAVYTHSGDGGGPTLPTDEATAPAGQVGGGGGEDASHPASNFKPFFTLIEDSNSSDYYHPTVHYIFSDDDTELITEASLRVLETGPVSPPAQNTQHGGDSQDASEMRNQQSSSLDRPSLLPPPLPGVKERFILLDVEPTTATATTAAFPSSAPDALAGTSAGTGTTMISTSPAQKQPAQPTAATPFGYRIVSAHSLTPDWQVLDASFSPAPTFDTPQQQNNDQTNALMLRIHGTAGFPRDIAPIDPTAAVQTLEEMMEQFDKRMSELRRVIETNGDYSPIATAETVQPGELDDNHGFENAEKGRDGIDATPPQQREDVQGEVASELAAAPGAEQ
ncbi:hypothetical protein UA08_01219 [Talaromyces atroroseus]|uniref:Anaphase-promoting complex subunit 11 RING-H2 finger domain-containing protein n=1 Tax=Talaromyces atroroseus TaxID=1441469 RepID=A0A1Q5QAR2_TALAT|nr:hypothetical protein UA08_01219 [Talaromyces atroroseus]OKL63037.1 hypothetical protein UA08_01219 [Talaromyces atroroseus]